MNEELMRKQIVDLGPWFHQIEITPTLRTRDIAPAPGPQNPSHPLSRWEAVRNHLPRDMRGMRVLDIGCADGFFTIEMARRGAEVLAVDAAPKMISRLTWATQQLGLNNVTARVGRIEDLDERERFDSVLFIALLYHLKSPLIGLEKLGQLTDTLLLETTVHHGDEPMLYFKPALEGVHSIPKWFPTRSCVEQMMIASGFDQTEQLPYETPNRALLRGQRGLDNQVDPELVVHGG